MNGASAEERQAPSERGQTDTERYALAMLNLLEDAVADRARLQETHTAMLNILEDFELEKAKAQIANQELRDEVAERLRAEKALARASAAAEAANKELEAFSYSVAHDLRAPLRSIDGFSQALLEDCADRLDDDGKRYLNHVRQAAQQMGELIDGLLHLSRVTRTELQRRHVDVSELAHRILARLQAAEPRRAVELIVQQDLVTRADPRLVDVVLTNLLGNAWKFTSKRESGRIEVAATNAEPAVFFVRDNGAGFDPAYAAKLFGVFQRLHGAHEFEGTGIGLATAQRIVHRHGGRIWADGAVDQGATFYFTLEDSRT